MVQMSRWGLKGGRRAAGHRGLNQAKSGNGGRHFTRVWQGGLSESTGTRKGRPHDGVTVFTVQVILPILYVTAATAAALQTEVEEQGGDKALA